MHKTISSKKISTAIILGLIIVALYSFRAHAQENGMAQGETHSNTQSSEAVPMMEQARTLHRGTLPPRAQDRIINLSENIRTRLTASISRLTAIADRIDSRAKKMSAAGANTQAAEERLARAREELASAKQTLDSIQSVPEIIRGETPKDSYLSIREQFKTVQTGIKAAHTTLKETVGLLKEAANTSTLDHGVSSAVTNASDTPAVAQ